MARRADHSEHLFAIVDRLDGRLVDLCSGPVADGGCPRSEAGAPPCAGHRVIPMRGTRADGLPFSIPSTASGAVCPVGWLGH